MSTRTILVGLLAIAAGGAAAIGARQLVQQYERPALDENVTVVTVAREVPRGERLARERLAVEEWPQDKVPDAALTNMDDAIGRVALTPLFEGQPVYDNLLASRDVPAGMATLVPEGMRAFTIHTPTIASGVAGFVLPGNYVDVLLTVSGREAIGARSGGALTVTLLQRVEILAVDQVLDAPTQNRVDAKSLKSVTLLVTPEQAGKLSLAQNKGTLELSLRNPGDQEPVDMTPVTVADLQFLTEEPTEPEETNEEIFERLLAERMTAREAELAKSQAEREEALKTEMRLAFEEELQREMDAARAELAKLQREEKPETPSVLLIRTLRGTHSGFVRVTPGTNTIENSIVQTSDD